MKSLSRRSLLKAGAVATAGAALAGLPQVFGSNVALAQFSSDVDVLNYALTLEHLEYAFYRDGLNTVTRDSFNIIGGSLQDVLYGYIEIIRDHELAHVQTLQSVISSLGGTPVQPCTYNFGYSDARGFAQVAQALENTGVMAYNGAIAFIQSPDLRTAAATIATVEARHAAFLNLLNGAVPFPDAFDQAKSKDEILAIAGQFIVSCP